MYATIQYALAPGVEAVITGIVTPAAAAAEMASRSINCKGISTRNEHVATSLLLTLYSERRRNRWDSVCHHFILF